MQLLICGKYVMVAEAGFGLYNDIVRHRDSFRLKMPEAESPGEAGLMHGTGWLSCVYLPQRADVKGIEVL